MKKIRQLTKEQISLLREHNKTRSAVELPELKVIVRRCIICGNLFESTARRTCGCIREKASALSGLDII